MPWRHLLTSVPLWGCVLGKDMVLNGDETNPSSIMDIGKYEKRYEKPVANVSMNFTVEILQRFFTNIKVSTLKKSDFVQKQYTLF